ncbi:MAG: type IV secretion system protein [Novosphingobium sp.]|nr:type IV secretion system protein [Novosphingobium sp.]
MNECADLVNAASAGVSPALRAVDCVAGQTTAAAFNRLFGVDGSLAPVLTILLTLYIVFFAFSLLTGRSRIGISALTPRMMTLGVVLTFATSWVAYQGVLWNLAVGGPDWIASVLSGTTGSATQIFADRIDIVFNAIAQVSEAAGAQGAGASTGQASGASGSFSAADAMWLGAILLLLGTVGVLLTARIALAVLLALGPVFIVMALFGGTRGLTAGWLRGVTLTALAPLFVVLGGGITLELLVPVVGALAQSTEGVSGRGAMALFLIAAVHVALMGMVMKVAVTMVSGWNVFGLASAEDRTEARGPGIHGGGAVSGSVASQPTYGPSATQAQTARRPAVVPAGSPAPVGTASAGDSPARASERRTVVTQVSGGGLAITSRPSANRAAGIGSRFRSASNDSGRSQMKFKESAR